MSKPKYQDYKIDCVVIHRESKLIYQIVKRSHKERTVLLKPLEGMEKWAPTHYKHMKYNSLAYQGHNWRTHKELNKNYSLLDRKVARVLYGTKV